MKKVLWAAGILFAVIVAVLLAATLFVKSYLKSEKLKSIIIPKVEEITGRSAEIEGIDVSIFKGIVVKGINIRERGGNAYFIKTGEFILDYSLSRLLKKEIVIKKIEIVSPYIYITREKDGGYNFSDISDKLAALGSKGATPEGQKKGLPFAIIADRLYIKDAVVEFKDDLKELPDITAKADIEIMSPTEIGQKDFVPAGRLTLKEMKAVMKGLQTNTAGSIDADREVMTVNLNTVVDKDVIKLSGTIKDYLKSPDAKLNLYAKEINLDKILPPAPTGKKTVVGKRKGEVAVSKKQTGEKGGADNIRASGEIKADAARYKGYDIKGFHLTYSYKDGVMAIEPLETRFGGGEKVRAEGDIKGNLRFNYGVKGGDISGIKQTLSGKGVLNLSRCEVRQSKITDAIALFTGLDDLKKPNFENSRFNWNIGNRKLLIEGNMNSSQIKLNPYGSVDFDERIDLTADLMLSPSMTAKLPAGKITGYLKDEKGWAVIPLKIGGTMEKPSVRLNPAAARGIIERGVKDEIEKRLFKNKEEQPSKEGPTDILKGIFGK